MLKQSKIIFFAVSMFVIILLIGLFIQTAENNKKDQENSSLQKQTQELTAELNKINHYARIQKTILTDVVFAKADIPIKTRLDLEQAIKELNDNTLSTKWQNFAESKNKEETQTAMENLLEYLALKVAE